MGGIQSRTKRGNKVHNNIYNTRQNTYPKFSWKPLRRSKHKTQTIQTVGWLKINKTMEQTGLSAKMQVCKMNPSFIKHFTYLFFCGLSIGFSHCMTHMEFLASFSSISIGLPTNTT